MPARLRPVIRAARSIAEERGTRLYLAGGVVRDLILRRPAGDADFVVSGDSAGFARCLAGRFGGTVKIHERFATATVVLRDGSRLDVAEARRETYDRPGALPRISPGASIEEDLARRDFTVNAMALELHPGPRRLVDPFGGREDLARGVIRMLHEHSALDDPTRALRAVRYAHRLGFRIAPSTRRSIRRAVEAGAFEAVSGDRLRREIVSILAGSGRGGALRLLHSLGLDAAIAPALAQQGAARRVRRVEELIHRVRARVGWLGYFLAWMAPASARDRRKVADRLTISGRERARLDSWPRTLRRLRRGLAKRSASEARIRSRGISEDEILAAAAVLPQADSRAVLRQARRTVTLGIRGADLREAGIPAGPEIGAALARTLAAREDGVIAAGEELSFALHAARALAGRARP